MNSTLKVLLSTVCFFALGVSQVFAQGQDVIEVTSSATSDKTPATAARQDIFDKVTQETSVQYIRELLGEVKYEKNKDLIKNKIIQNSPKYILFMKGGSPKKNGELTEMEVTLKFSVKSLEALLLNEGLLYRMDGPPRALPMLSVIDRVNSKSFSWWVGASGDDKSFLVQQAEVLNKKLRDQLRSRGFYGLNPAAGFGMLTPEVFQTENPPTDDFLFMGEFYQSQIVVRGDVLIKPGETSQNFGLEIRMLALHSGNGRIVGEVIRTYSTENGAFQKVVAEKINAVADQVCEDLAVQLHDAWKSGTFGASLIRLTVLGDLDYQQMTQLKKLLLTQVKDLKTLKERHFSPGRVSFEVDSSVGARQLAEMIQGKDFPRFKVEVSEVRNDGVDIKVNSL